MWLAKVMPELPEVETIVRQLRQKIIGKTVQKIELLDGPVIDRNVVKIVPFKITKISRRGKSIIMHLDDGHFLLTSLRMTGHFHYLENKNKEHKISTGAGSTGANNSYQKFLCGIFYFSDGSFLTHNSIRKFGRIILLDSLGLEETLSKLGPEPLAADFTAEKFIAVLTSFPQANIKSKLLDQKCLAGIGNIYAQEALYYAGINPQLKIREIPLQRLARLYRELRRMLLLSIKHQGSTVDNYTNLQGKGSFQNLLAVYNQVYCPKNHKLEKIKSGGRSTSYCPLCQN